MRLLTVVSITLLSGCATSASLQALESSGKTFKEYESAVMETTYDPIEHSGPATTESDAVASSRWAIAWPICEAEMVNVTQPTPASIESTLVGCLNRHQLKVKIDIWMGDKVMPLSKYLKEFFNAGALLKDDQAQVDQERTGSALTIMTVFAGALAGAANSRTNASLVDVSPYRKNDGTYVRPHVRTAPNSTCLDNLSGCR